MHTAVVSTGSRGIGLEFATQLLKRPYRVICLIRSPKVPTTGPLASLLSQYGPDRLVVIPQVDLEQQSSIDAARNKIFEQVDVWGNLGSQQLAPQNSDGRGGGQGGIDLLINSAGVLGDGVTTPGPERALSRVQRPWLQHTFEVNVIGHVMMTQALLPRMQKSTSQARERGLSRIVNISARVGSIGDCALGGWLSYRMSKSALNMFTKALSVEVKRSNVVVASLHPGTTDTDLSVPFQKNVQADKLLPVSTSVGCMLSVIDGLGLEESGGFFAYDGKSIEY
jgi:NAD(P)-dependent dehydrogenase (short-subunit alcohol dehydrogenase family)